MQLSRYISQDGAPIHAGKVTLTGYFSGEIELADHMDEAPDYVWGNSGSVALELGERVIYFEGYITGWSKHPCTGEPVIDLDTVDARWVDSELDELDEDTLADFVRAAGGEAELYWAIDDAILDCAKAAGQEALAILESEVAEWKSEHSDAPSVAS